MTFDARRFGLSRIAPLFLGILAAGWVGALAAGETAAVVEENRARYVEVVGRMDSPFAADVLQGIREAGEFQDEKLVGEFKIIERLLAIVGDNQKFVRERVAAVGALVELYKNGIGEERVLRFLTDLIQQKRDDAENAPLLVRKEALRLIAEMAGGDSLLSDKVYTVLTGLLKDARNLPAPLVAALYEAIGAYYARGKEVREALLDGMQDRRPVVREGALQGLRRYLKGSGDTSDDIVRRLLLVLQRAETAEQRVQAIDGLELVAAHGADVVKNGELKDTLLKLLATGNDREVQASIRFLMYALDQPVVEAFLAGPPAGGELETETRIMFDKALVSVWRTLPDRRKWKKEVAEDIAKRMVNHFVNVINPTKNAPQEARINAIIGLGVIPSTFDRTTAYKILVRVLEVDKTPEIVYETEKSMEYLTGGAAPFRKEDPATREMIPDVDAYKKWFEENQKNLEAGKSPVG